MHHEPFKDAILDPKSSKAMTARSTSGAPEVWHVTALHGPGSVEHFHHFLLGLLVPLIHQISTTWSRMHIDRLLVRSCGPLDGLMREFDDPRIEIIEAEQHRAMVLAASRATEGSVDGELALRFVQIPGCDYPSTYNRRIFKSAKQVLQSAPSIQSETLTLSTAWPYKRARILLIRRAPPHAFYSSDRCEVQTSGAERRSISNHPALYHALQELEPGTIDVAMESLTLARQVALFSLADVVIAQHGAALSNLIWTRPTTTVIEVVPMTLRAYLREEDFFRNLARCLGLRYQRLLQPHDHGDVDIAEMSRIVTRCITSPPSLVRGWTRALSFETTRQVTRAARQVRARLTRPRS